jgi:uncharacterized protein YggL (DUF469 family)
MVEQAKLLAVFSFDGDQADGSAAAVVAAVDHFIAAVVVSSRFSCTGSALRSLTRAI